MRSSACGWWRCGTVPQAYDTVLTISTRTVARR
jgi:hypothetical protein